MRLRICSAKCGVDAPISWRTSSTVGSRRTRSARSYSLMAGRLPAAGGHRDQRGRGVDACLRVGADRVAPAEYPDVVVDALARVVALEARLDVEQVALERAGERRRLVR